MQIVADTGVCNSRSAAVYVSAAEEIKTVKCLICPPGEVLNVSIFMNKWDSVVTSAERGGGGGKRIFVRSGLDLLDLRERRK